MAHFYGMVTGARGAESRLGTKGSGMATVAASWQGAVAVSLIHDPATGKDMALVRLVPWKGAGVDRTLYSGSVDGSGAGEGPGSGPAASERPDPAPGSDPWLRGYEAGYKAAQDALGVRFVGDSLMPAGRGV